MIISTKSLKPIEWQEKDFEFIGVIGGTIQFCVVTPEYSPTGWKTLNTGVMRTGRWIIRYSMKNMNGKPFGEYANSLEEAKEQAAKFLEGSVNLITKGAER